MENILLLTVLQMFSLNTAFDFSCPSQAHWNLRAKSMCTPPRNYTCLYNVTFRVNVYKDKCNKPGILAAGYKYVFQPNLNRATCSQTRYQPFIFDTVGRSDCTFMKSLCNNLGQMMYKDGNTTSDRTCICNKYEKYAYVKDPQNQCYCNPSVEDCSCYIDINTINKTGESKDFQCYDKRKMNLTHPLGDMNTSQEIKINEFDNYKYNQDNRPNKKNRRVVAILVLILLCAYLVIWLKLQRNIRRWIRIPKFDIFGCTESSITIGWCINDSDNCPQYEISYQLQGSDKWKNLIFSNEDVLITPNGRRMYELQNLLHETWYEVKIRAVDNHSKSRYTECKKKQTLKRVPNEFDIFECTESSITIGWCINDSDNCSQYEISYQLQGSDKWKNLTCSIEDVLTTSNGRRMYKLQNLLHETWYEVKMRAVDNHIKSRYTECKETQTFKLVPKEFDIIESTESSITIEWYTNDSEECQQYDISYQLQGSDNWKDLTFSTVAVLTMPNGRRTYKLQNLLHETWYEVKIRAVDNDSKSRYTECKKKQTLKLDSVQFSQPQNINDWVEFFRQLKQKSLLNRKSGKIQRGSNGHDVTLVLDCSERMRGKKFTTMIEAATKYVNGIKQVKMATKLEDNIGLAVFGGRSGLIVESTSNYDLVLEEISQLRPAGEAPLFGGFLMGLSGVLETGATPKIFETEVPGYMIVFTDEMAGNTPTDKENEPVIDPLYLIRYIQHNHMRSTISMIANQSIKIIYVPIGENLQNEVMEMAVFKTKGRVILLKEHHRLVKMTQELLLAAQVASDLRHTKPNPTEDDVRSSIFKKISHSDNAHDDCVGLVLEFVNPLSQENNRGLYSELDCQSLQLGDRVRRGQDWMHEEPDSGLVGTVVGQDQDRGVWVEWDSGLLKIYIYDECMKFYSIKKVQEPRVLVDELVAVGCKVTRGNDWKYNNDDGGPGSIGTVLGVKHNGSVVVCWDCKNSGVYKMKTNDSFEIQICTDAPTNKETDKVNLSTNKQKSAQLAIVNPDASKQKISSTAITKHSDQQEDEPNDKSVTHANTESDSVDSSQPQNIKEWIALNKRLRKQSLLKCISGKIQRGSHGHDVTLVLDCSERMSGQAFTTMIEAAKKYVNGIKQVKMVTSLEDNIGLAIFGGKSGLVVESTSNYDLVLEKICQLRPAGEAPLFGGFLMGLSGVLGIGATSQILDNEVPGYMIVFTDGMAGNTSTDKKKESGIDPSYLIGNVHMQDDMERVISMIAKHLIKIFYVPIGDNIRNEVMEMAACKTKGKVIQLKELHRLVKMTQVLILAAQVASGLRRTNPNPTGDDVRSSILQRTSNPDDAHDDCVDFVLEFVNPLSAEQIKGLFNELECRSLQLGDRVRRGRDWRFEEQDSGLAGTVVGQDQDKDVWVEWDSGHLNIYIYNEQKNNYSIKKVQEPRVLVGELVAVGCKVTRGHDWTYDNDDGGSGNIGTVLSVKQNGSVVVRWDCKKIGVYKIGTNGLFEIQICTESPTNKQTDKVDLTTNSAEFANTENEFQKLLSNILGKDGFEHTNITELIEAEKKNFNEFQKLLTDTFGLDGFEHTNITELIEAENMHFNDQDPSRQPRSTIEWLSYAEQLRENAMTRLQSGSVKRGKRGHDVALVLDCSKRMKGAKFDTMIETAKIYVNGIKQIKRVRMLEDNIGLAVFGGTSKVIVQTTSDYDLVLKEIGQLKPEGEAPLVGGLLMGLACALGGGTSEILGNEVPGYMVVFTDGMSANIKPELDQDIDPSFLIGDFNKHDRISSIIKKIAGFEVKIFYVPIGDNEQNEVMKSAVCETNGKVICRQEIHRLVRMTQVLMLAAEVASDLKKNNSNPTGAEVREKIVQQTSRPDDAHNDCVDLVWEFVKPRIKGRKKGLYSELVCRTLLLGDRVRRGPVWKFGEQDSGLAGTVVGQDSDNEAVWVEWDNGHLNMYIYDERRDIYSIKKVQEPRVLVDELVAVGCKVTRGKDWTYGDADGGLGSVGTVLRVNKDGSVLVRWDSRSTGEYKMGMNGLFEIQI